MVRISGPQTVDCLKNCFSCHEDDFKLTQLKTPTVVTVTIRSPSQNLDVPCDLFLWPTKRSYTRQLIAELRKQCANQVTHSEVCGCRLALRLEVMYYLMGLYAPNHLTTDDLERIIANTMKQEANREAE